MNRIIKFRGMDLKGNWHYGLPCNIQTDKHSAKRGWYISNSVGISTAYDIRPETLGQFTGLLDKNGKEIYEGDIVKDWNDNSILGNISEIYFEAPEFIRRDWGKRPFTFFRKGEYEVIGNIYENPELIN